MAIVGIGNDIVDIKRIEHALARSPRLVQRVLAEEEQVIFANHPQPARYFAKRFAAKEAAAKALGTGIGRGISFQHFVVSNNERGQPQLQLQDAALVLATELGVTNVWVSLSDEVDYALATVILERT
jgi:holo-[acyl-carrier protein] synthase